jgi:hypothetical protein
MAPMDTQSDLPVWDLWLSEKPPHKLIRSEFRLKPGGAPRTAIRPKDFRWTPGVQALMIANVQYKTRCMEGEQGDIVTEGELESPAASLAMALAQAEQQKIAWPANMCGERKDGAAILCNYYEHHQRDKGVKGVETFVVAVRRSMLSPDNIHVRFVKGKRQWELTRLEELKALGKSLCDHWKGKQNLPLPRPTEAQLSAAPAAQPISPSSTASNTPLTDFLAKITSPQTTKETPSPRPDDYLSEADFRFCQGFPGIVIKGRGKRPFLAFSRQPSLRLVYTYIELRLAAAKDRAALLDKVLEPKWIHLIAEKLTAGHVKEHALFYRNFQVDGSDKIKQAVSDLIQRNSDLGDQMIKNVLTCCDSCIEALSEWLSASADFYSKAFVKRFETPLLLALDTPTTRKWLTHYFDYALPSLTDCLAAFTKAEAYNGVRAIIRICLQNDLFFLRKGLEKNGKDSVLRFWDESTRLMTDEQRKQVRRFLKKRGLLLRDEG